MSENHKDVKAQELQRHHSDLYPQGNSGVHSSDQEQGSSHHMHMHNMHLPGQIDDVHGDAQLNSGDASAHMQLQYVPDHGHSLHHNNESGIDDDHDDGGSDGMDGDVPSDAANLAISAIPPRAQGSNQLTLSFQGEVYVFDSVSPEKHIGMDMMFSLEEDFVEVCSVYGSMKELLEVDTPPVMTK